MNGEDTHAHIFKYRHTQTVYTLHQIYIHIQKRTHANIDMHKLIHTTPSINIQKHTHMHKQRHKRIYTPTKYTYIYRNTHMQIQTDTNGYRSYQHTKRHLCIETHKCKYSYTNRYM